MSASHVHKHVCLKNAWPKHIACSFLHLAVKFLAHERQSKLESLFGKKLKSIVDRTNNVNLFPASHPAKLSVQTSFNEKISVNSDDKAALNR